MWIAFDIETIPNKRSEEYFTNIKRYKAPSNYTDPIKMQEYIEKQKLKDFKKAGLYWWTGQIVTICLENVVSKNKKTFIGSDEKELLNEFLTFYTAKCDNKPLVGKSSKDFDLPFIKGRLLAHDLGMPISWQNTAIVDVDEIFSNSRSCAQVSNLDAYAFGLGLETKPFDGSKVHDLWLNDQIKELEDYCKHDTYIVAEMLRRYMKVYKG